MWNMGPCKTDTMYVYASVGSKTLKLHGIWNMDPCKTDTIYAYEDVKITL